MRIAVPAAGPDPASAAEERFGRAPGFLILDTQSGSWEFAANTQNYDAPQGAGIQSAAHLVNAGVDAVCSPNLGPKAYAVLQQAGIPVYVLQAGSVADNAAACQHGRLPRMDGANQDGHW